MCPSMELFASANAMSMHLSLSTSSAAWRIIAAPLFAEFVVLVSRDGSAFRSFSSGSIHNPPIPDRSDKEVRETHSLSLTHAFRYECTKHNQYRRN